MGASASWPPAGRRWAKAHRGGESYHLLPYHLLDVGACAFHLIQGAKHLSEGFARLLDASQASSALTMAWLVSLHDIGKLHPSFQGLRPDIARRLGAPHGGTYDPRHDTLAACAFRQGLADAVSRILAPNNAASAEEWRAAVHALIPMIAGHHGSPPASGMSAGRWREASVWGAVRVAEAEAIARSLADAMGLVKDEGAHPDVEGIRHASWEIAGFVTLADWLGSDETRFPMCEQEMPLADYWRNTALPAAQKAVEDSGVLPVAIAHRSITEGILPPGATPTPLQAQVGSLTIADEASLYIIEDQTGAGKTEAALLLARRLLQSGSADGLYFGLPTAATSDAMYRRLRAIYGSFFESATGANLSLAHGRARASASDDALDVSTSWLLDGRKRALLAHVGVGTIDQALLGVLPVRHQSLRLFALSGRILIVDEVHAYDRYVLTLIEKLLVHHLGRGGSAILLSATLPTALRAKLCALAGASEGVTIGQAAPFPLITRALRGRRALETPVAPREGLARTIRIVVHETPETVTKALLHQVHGGSCAAWIRNTVSDVMESGDALVADQPSVMHARFVNAHRRAKEQALLTWAGPMGSPAERAGKLVVASQVIEQSLDVDFDVLATDLAPIDIILQRAGRLHRHARGDRGPPTLHVLAPRWSNEPRRGWFASAFPRASHVYEDDAVLWHTLRLLRENAEIQIPADSRRLVEGVYGTDVAPPPGLAGSAVAARAGQGVRYAAAEMGSLNLAGGYADDASKWEDDTRAKTRFGESTADAWLAQGSLDDPSPLFGNWDDSRIGIPLRWLAATGEPPTRRAPIDAWRPERLLMMEGGEDLWETTWTTERGTIRRIRYDARQGLREVKGDDGDEL